MKLLGRIVNFFKKRGEPSPLYQLEEIDGCYLSAIKILKGDYKDVVYFYGDVKFLEKTLSFKTEIHQKPEHLGDLSKDEAFTKVSGDILVELINKQIETNNPALVKK